MPKSKYIVNIGDTYDRLTVVKDLGVKDKQRWYECLCECGNRIKTTKYRLVYGTCKSCGCLKSENLKYRDKKEPTIISGNKKKFKKQQPKKAHKNTNMTLDEPYYSSENDFARSYLDSVFKRL
ncbi:MAG: hypothetical protein IJT36_01805 [Alphaproteobacteria bacterium]|nr:hypothetical protein [Alphaproteobacteria bacterium]